MILKPSEVAPISGLVFAEIMHEAGVPAGVFNLINGDGPTVGEAMASHPDIHMISITGFEPRRRCRGKGRSRDRQARASGTRRQVRQYHPSGRRGRFRAAVREGTLECFDNTAVLQCGPPACWSRRSGWNWQPPSLPTLRVPSRSARPTAMASSSTGRQPDAI